MKVDASKFSEKQKFLIFLLNLFFDYTPLGSLAMPLYLCTAVWIALFSFLSLWKANEKNVTFFSVGPTPRTSIFWWIIKVAYLISSLPFLIDPAAAGMFGAGKSRPLHSLSQLIHYFTWLMRTVGWGSLMGSLIRAYSSSQVILPLWVPYWLPPYHRIRFKLFFLTQKIKNKWHFFTFLPLSSRCHTIQTHWWLYSITIINHHIHFAQYVYCSHSVDQQEFFIFERLLGTTRSRAPYAYIDL